MADVAQAEDPYHPLALVDDRQPTDLQCLHVLHSFGKVILLTAAMDTGSHHIARRDTSGIEAVVRQPLADDVTVRHHADQPNPGARGYTGGAGRGA